MKVYKNLYCENIKYDDFLLYSIVYSIFICKNGRGSFLICIHSYDAIVHDNNSISIKLYVS